MYTVKNHIAGNDADFVWNKLSICVEFHNSFSHKTNETVEVSDMILFPLLILINRFSFLIIFVRDMNVFFMPKFILPEVSAQSYSRISYVIRKG